jgi:hypothetical protein
MPTEQFVSSASGLDVFKPYEIEGSILFPSETIQIQGPQSITPEDWLTGSQLSILHTGIVEFQNYIQSSNTDRLLIKDPVLSSNAPGAPNVPKLENGYWGLC